MQRLVLVILSSVFWYGFFSSSVSAQHENIALNKPYTLNPVKDARNNRHWNAKSETILTDGKYATHGLWTAPATVQWMGPGRNEIIIDLGDHYPIRGLSVSGEGYPEIRWPWKIDVLVSVDGEAWHPVADLIDTSPPPADRRGKHRFRTDRLRTHGRYVQIIVYKQTHFFVDEIEVFRGEDSWKNLPLPREVVYYGLSGDQYEGDEITRMFKQRLSQDLGTARAHLEMAEGLPDELRRRLTAQIPELANAIGALPDVDPATIAEQTYPLNRLHAQIYAIHGAIRAAQNQPPVTAWKMHRWDFLRPISWPDANSPQPGLSFAAMRGETRSDVVNFTNNTEQDITLQLSFDGLPATPRGVVHVHRVGFTDAREWALVTGHIALETVAAVLPEIMPRSGKYALTLPAGMTTQLWIAFTPNRNIPAGVHEGRLVVDGPVEDIPLTLRVFDFDFPQRTRLAVGGWDFSTSTDAFLAHHRAVTDQNRQQLIEHMQSRRVNMPMGQRHLEMPLGEFDSQGRYSRTPDTRNFDRWVEAWPNAQRYLVFNVTALLPTSDPQFARKIGEWTRFWMAHARSRGIQPEQIMLAIVDEPGSREQDEVIIAWSKAVKAAEPRAVIWDNGHRTRDRWQPDLIAAVDYITPMRPRYTDESAFDFYRELKQAGKRMDFYSAFDKPRFYDPYTYFVVAGWDAFVLGGESSHFWAFVDTGRQTEWNEFRRRLNSYAPMFITPTSVTAGKHMEAIRESAQDYEYLMMLQDQITELEKQRGRSDPTVARLRGLLQDGPRRVVTKDGAVSMPMLWRQHHDRSVADQVRIQIGEQLEQVMAVRRPQPAPAATAVGTTPSVRQRAAQPEAQQLLIMARAYRDAGLDSEARELLQKVITEHPDTPWAEQARAMLEER